MGATPIIIKYPLDLTGSASSNAIVNELHTVPRDNSRGFALDYGPFYSESLVITRPSTGEILKPHIDYIALHQYQEATLIAGQEICAAVLIINETIAEELSVSYQVVGGGFSSSVPVIQELVEALQLDNRAVAWGDIIGKLEAFPAAPHYHDLDDFYGFEYMVSALDRIEAAILHGDYYDHELLRQRIANLRAELLQAIDDQADSQTLHLGDFANPHKVTKAQVGLGNVSNFGTATEADGAAGTSTTLFMTPAAVFAAINAKAGLLVDGHSGRLDNPHNTTKAQVGLGNVANFAVASTAEAQAGTATDKYMTPYLVKVAIDNLASGSISTHVNRVDNPHAVTAAQVGLGNVDNFATASQAEAQAVGATATLPLNKFMTVRRVAEMIDARGGTEQGNHAGRTDNPHSTTAAQVGLGNVQNYGVATSADVSAGKTTSTASNTVYITALRLVEYVANRLGNVANLPIATNAEYDAGGSNAHYATVYGVSRMISRLSSGTVGGHLADFDNPHKTTAAQVGLGNVQNFGLATQTEAQTMSDSASNAKYMTPWLVYRALITHLGRIDSASVLNSVAAHINNTSNPHNTTAAQVGLGNVQNFSVASQVDAETGSSNGVYMTPLRTFQAIARYLANEGWSTVKAHVNRTDNPHATTKAQVGLGSVQNFPIATDTEYNAGSSNAHYATVYGVSKMIARLSSGTVGGHLADMSNPHNTTKAQVGLGNVENFAVASQGDAEIGTSNGTYMTPLRTAQAIARYFVNQGWPGVKGHLTDVNNPHVVTKTQVGLSNVQNYGLSSMAAAQAGTANDSYMTPVRVWDAIAQYLNVNGYLAIKNDWGWWKNFITSINDSLVSHVGKKDNPHAVTKAQVGLGNVPNYPAATSSDMEWPGGINGSNGSKLVTPFAFWNGLYSYFGRVTARSTKSIPRNKWVWVHPAADGVFDVRVAWNHADNVANAFSYYYGAATFGTVSGRNNPQFSVKEFAMNGVGSYGSEACKLQIRADGLYIYCSGGYKDGAGITDYQQVNIAVQQQEWNFHLHP